MTVMDSYKHGGDAPCEISVFKITGLFFENGFISRHFLVILERHVVIPAISNILRYPSATRETVVATSTKTGGYSETEISSRPTPNRRAWGDDAQVEVAD